MRKIFEHCKFGLLWVINEIQNIFRKPNEKLVIVMLDIDPSVLHWLQTEAKEKGKTLDELVNQILQETLARELS